MLTNIKCEKRYSKTRCELKTYLAQHSLYLEKKTVNIILEVGRNTTRRKTFCHKHKMTSRSILIFNVKKCTSKIIQLRLQRDLFHILYFLKLYNNISLTGLILYFLNFVQCEY